LAARLETRKLRRTDRYWLDPAHLLGDAGLSPDDWQADLIRGHSERVLLNCSRQSGKSTVAAALALQAAMLEYPALVLLLSPTLRQSAELFLKVMTLYQSLSRPVPSARPRDSALKLELVNGSRILSLPSGEATVRGFSGVRLLIVDEAARVPDDLYRAVRPMLAVSGGRLLALSTPFGRRGWFYEEWTAGADTWHRVKITADQCPRIAKEFLDEERLAIGDRWWRQEYFCSFEELVGAVFRAEDIEAAFANDLEPLFHDP
jgi:hypothetical protein